ncbi:response regulator [Zavarzinia sp.]|uniref:response regulator n=1 Tax=Zavarzinia sp. TaxID=2027920 RepID=UPI003BB4B74E|nr:response regulator [Zavarzinia sp.]
MSSVKEKPRAKSPTILVVDDDEDLRSELVELFGRIGYNVLEACNGIEAVEIARERRPDVVLMDVGMPQLGGVRAAEIMTLLRHTEQVVLMSGNPELVAEAASHRGLAPIVLNKPLSFDICRRVIDSLAKPGA